MHQQELFLQLLVTKLRLLIQTANSSASVLICGENHTTPELDRNEIQKWSPNINIYGNVQVYYMVQEVDKENEEMLG